MAAGAGGWCLAIVGGPTEGRTREEEEVDIEPADLQQRVGRASKRWIRSENSVFRLHRGDQSSPTPAEVVRCVTLAATRSDF